MSNRVVVIVNKWYECDPFLAALLNDHLRPPGWRTSWREPACHPRRRTNSKASAGTAFTRPRVILTLRRAEIEIWCISDLLEDLPDVSSLQSSARHKAERLPVVFKGAPPALVIAVGTAALAVGSPLPSAEAAAGHVVIGTSVFMHDAHPERTGLPDHWGAGPFGALLPSTLSLDCFHLLVDPLAAHDAEVSRRFVLPPVNPARGPRVLAGRDHVSVGTLNVTDVAEYATADRAALEAHGRAGGDPSRARSVETTHGLIRVQSEAPFLFISGIANRALAASEDLLPRKEAQDTAAATNAGVTLGWMLPQIDLALAAPRD